MYNLGKMQAPNRDSEDQNFGSASLNLNPESYRKKYILAWKTRILANCSESESQFLTTKFIDSLLPGRISDAGAGGPPAGDPGRHPEGDRGRGGRLGAEGHVRGERQALRPRRQAREGHHTAQQAALAGEEEICYQTGHFRPYYST